MTSRLGAAVIILLAGTVAAVMVAYSNGVYESVLCDNSGCVVSDVVYWGIGTMAEIKLEDDTDCDPAATYTVIGHHSDGPGPELITVLDTNTRSFESDASSRYARFSVEPSTVVNCTSLLITIEVTR